MPTVVYLHGFTSSPASSKAAFFKERLGRRGVRFHCPDFNEPDFASLTMTRMLGQLRGLREDVGEPVTLLGSSLGGTVAVLAAERFGPSVDRLVLLAPAVMFAKPGHHLLPPDRIEQWKQEGSMAFFHYMHGAARSLNYSFYDDSLQYDAYRAMVIQPTLIFQGLKDASVDYRTVQAFADGRSNMTLSLLDDDHQLIESLPRIWNDMAPFLELPA